MTRFSLAAVCLCCIGCAPPRDSAPSQSEKAAIADTIASVSATWRHAAEQGDAAAVLAHYAKGPETAVAIGDNSQQRSITLESLAATLPAQLHQLRSQTIGIAEQKIGVLSRSAVAETAIGSWASTDTTGHTTTNHFAYTRVWVRGDSGWKIVQSNLTVLPVPILRE
jgi:ketosteroid isomerase-like protein